GQVVIIPKIEKLSSAIVCDDAPLMYAIPRANDCVFGGTNEISDNLAVDPGSTARILEECSRVLEIEKPNVLAERVGLRPFRRSGVRLERARSWSGSRWRCGKASSHSLCCRSLHFPPCAARQRRVRMAERLQESSAGDQSGQQTAAARFHRFRLVRLLHPAGQGSFLPTGFQRVREQKFDPSGTGFPAARRLSLAGASRRIKEAKPGSCAAIPGARISHPHRSRWRWAETLGVRR